MADETPSPVPADETSLDGSDSSPDQGSDGAQPPAAESGRTRAAQLPGWLARLNPRIAAAAVGMLAFGAAGYAIGNHRPVAVQQNASVTVPGGPMGALGRPESKSARTGDAAFNAQPGTYYSNVLTADNPAQWPGITAGETRPGYASKADEAMRKEFADRLIVLLGLPAKMKSDGTVEWSECADGLCRSLGVMADADGNFNATTGNWPGACIAVAPGSPGVAVPEGKIMPLPAESAMMSPSAGSAGGATSGSTGLSDPVPAQTCPEPKPAPAEASVRQAAAGWVGILGLTTDTAAIDVSRQVDSYVTNAYIYQVIDGMRSRLMATLTYAEDTYLVSVWGNFAPLVKVADYRVISAADAVKRTHDAQWSIAAQQVWDTSVPIALDTGVISPVVPTNAPLNAGNLAGRVEDVVVTDPKPSLMQVFDVNGNSVWVPAYRVTDKATGKTRWDVAAIESSYFGG